MPQFIAYYNYRTGSPGGGLITYIKLHIPTSLIETKITNGAGQPEWIITDIYLTKRIRIINVYFSPQANNHLTESILNRNDHFTTIICGDFNAHNTMWGNSSTDVRGRIIADHLMSTDTILLNDGQFTYYNPKGNKTAIDLTLVTNDIATLANWNPLSLFCGSHYRKIETDFSNIRTGKLKANNQTHTSTYINISQTFIFWATHTDWTYDDFINKYKELTYTLINRNHVHRATSPRAGITNANGN
ncbi:uncharacterized protein LOC111641338 [Centruroides sculpturatus]|uniref:uncharacterized protein LOC111641338 n=1 Tax=Centruroides sculpturatus TaxID=218467 RepID=UPI000C6ED71A|nr:uncharacterized protein LOC111641338 [Centruroides sculpturatus]